MFDVFYFGKKPNLFPFEQEAINFDNAAKLSRTKFFWLIHGDNDYSNFKFDLIPPAWQEQFIHVWPSQWQPDGNVYLCNIETYQNKQYYFRTDQSVVRTANKKYWTIPTDIDERSMDFSWHPNPLDPEYNYEFATQWYSEGGPVYKVPGATEIKYIDTPRSKLNPTTKNWKILHPIVKKSFDFSWAPHPREEPYIYVWGNQHWPAEKMPTLEYHVPGAIKRKYMEGIVKLDKNYSNWLVPDTIDPASVDFTWVPDPNDEPYIYEFATQWQPNGGARYVVPGATKIKYIDLIHRRLPIKDNWEILEDITDFDYSWHPSNTEQAYNYVFGNQHYPGTIMPTIKYLVQGATQDKFVDCTLANLAESKINWEILEDIDATQWDWTWRPNPLDPPYIYVFGNQWNPAEYKTSIRYIVPGATEVKYMESRTVRLPQPAMFEHNIPVDSFDYSWEPNPFDPPYIYVFGNQWNPGILEPTVIYTVNGATEIKYIDNIIAQISSDMTNWELLDDIKQFDYSWRPNPTDPPYIFVFGNQWLTPEQRPALRYMVPNATEIKYIDEPKAQRVGNPELFITHYNCEFDYSWEPDPGSPAYNYVFGNQHWPAEIMPTVEYRMDNATETKFINDIQAKLLPTVENWTTITDIPLEFDYSWQPDPGDPAYIYVFGNQWYLGQEMPTVEYRMSDATERKFVDTIHAKLLPVMDRWCVPEEVNSTVIDFTWVPHPKDDPYIHHFGSEFQTSVGLTYTAPGATELKFEGEIPLLQAQKQSNLQVLDIFFIDKSNAYASTRFERLKEKYPNIQKVRYVNSMLDTIKRCATRNKTTKFWIISSENVYDEFDFTWHAQPWQSYMTHVFGSQWQKWSDTFLINKWEFERNIQWAKSLEEFPNLNFVTDQSVYVPDDLHDVYFIDHGNEQDQFDKLKLRYPKIKTTRYVEDYLSTFKRIMSTATTEHVWIVSGLCIYDKFDFTWQPEPWQKEMIHVFGAGPNKQPRGNTFYIHVESFKQQMIELDMLDWFNVINYCNEQFVPMSHIPVHRYSGDDLVSEIKNFDFKHPYTLFAYNNAQTPQMLPSVWTAKDKKIYSISDGNRTVLVPREAKSYIQTQVYDYPYIEKISRRGDDPLDVIYISNGEPDAERWYNHLNDTLNGRDNITYTEIKRVKNVNGRAAAYKAAAELSETPWFFTVFAKLEIDPTFEWGWQPDYMQGPKHYIFHSKNPVNGLEYGHMGMIAYNKKLVLETDEWGLDFTLSKPHAVVPILSGTAHYNTTPELTWRTAFREVIKLKDDVERTGSIESKHRLKTWLTVATGNYAEWSIKGAEDAVAYYNQVAGDHSKLLLSFEWDWLKEYYQSRYC